MSALAVFFLILLVSGRGSASPSSSAPAPHPFTPQPLTPVPPTPARIPDLPHLAPQPSAVQPAPWPQVVPQGLPAFPGHGWTPDNPPPAAVQSRAWALLHALWTGGPGTFKTEQTAGRWITYQAQPMGTKKGVVAYRLA